MVNARPHAPRLLALGVYKFFGKGGAQSWRDQLKESHLKGQHAIWLDTRRSRRLLMEILQCTSMICRLTQY